jgi:hypothetical protein
MIMIAEGFVNENNDVFGFFYRIGDHTGRYLLELS